MLEEFKQNWPEVSNLFNLEIVNISTCEAEGCGHITNSSQSLPYIEISASNDGDSAQNLLEDFFTTPEIVEGGGCLLIFFFYFGLLFLDGICEKGCRVSEKMSVLLFRFYFSQYLNS